MMYLPKYLRDNAPIVHNNSVKCSICGDSRGFYSDDTLIRVTPKGAIPKIYAHKYCLSRQEGKQ